MHRDCAQSKLVIVIFGHISHHIFSLRHQPQISGRPTGRGTDFCIQKCDDQKPSIACGKFSWDLPSLGNGTRRMNCTWAGTNGWVELGGPTPRASVFGEGHIVLTGGINYIELATSPSQRSQIKHMQLLGPLTRRAFQNVWSKLAWVKANGISTKNLSTQSGETFQACAVFSTR